MPKEESKSNQTLCKGEQKTKEEHTHAQGKVDAFPYLNDAKTEKNVEMRKYDFSPMLESDPKITETLNVTDQQDQEDHMTLILQGQVKGKAVGVSKAQQRRRN